MTSSYPFRPFAFPCTFKFSTTACLSLLASVPPPLMTFPNSSSFLILNLAPWCFLMKASSWVGSTTPMATRCDLRLLPYRKNVLKRGEIW